MPRIASSLAALLLCSTALAGCASLGSLNPFGSSEAVNDKAAFEKHHAAEAPASDIAGGVRQAHDLRLAGKYDEASRILSQLMMVASDDPRVVGEYGKTLLQRGRSQDAVQFLTRAVELQGDDWSTYSALGVAYDQRNDRGNAKNAYEHALALAPREASILNNYALSRLLANDMDGARALATRAASNGGSLDPKIARNLAMIEATAPKVALATPPAPQIAAAAPAPVAAPTVASAPVASAPVAPQPRVAAAPAPQPKIVAAQVPPAPALVASTPVTSAPPRVLAPSLASNILPPGAQPFGVVMQPMPVTAPAVHGQLAADTGIIHLKPPVKAAPKALAKVEKPTEKIVPAPATKVAVKAEPGKPAPVKLAALEPAAKPVPAKAAGLPLAKPEPAAKPVADKSAAPVKAARPKPDGVPALRLASDASAP